MSLINQVLKDLEKRHAEPDAGALARAVRPLPEGQARRGLWLALGVGVIAVAAAGTWWWKGRDAAPPVMAKQPVLPAAAPQVKAPEPIVQTVPSAPAAIATQPSVAPAANASAPGATAAPSVTVQPSVDVNQRSAPLSPMNQRAAALPKPATSAPSLERQLQSGQPVVARETSTTAVTLAADAIDSEAAPVKSKPTVARLPARSATLPKPKISASVKSVEYADAEASRPVNPTSTEKPTNIEKQVRQPTERERADAIFRQAMNAMQSGGLAEAEAGLHEALRLDPALDEARQALLGLYVEAGRRDEAERLLEQRLQLDPGHIAFAMALARLQLERGANNEALASLQRSSTQGANSADYHAMFANALSRTGRHKEAAEHFADAARLAPRNPLWPLGLGVELRTDNRHAEARAAFQRARELGGLNAQLTSYLDQQLRELQ